VTRRAISLVLVVSEIASLTGCTTSASIVDHSTPQPVQVTEAAPLRSDANVEKFRQLRIGMSRDEVYRIMGYSWTSQAKIYGGEVTSWQAASMQVKVTITGGQVTGMKLTDTNSGHVEIIGQPAT
jgi:hypothetical protein